MIFEEGRGTKKYETRDLVLYLKAKSTLHSASLGQNKLKPELGLF